MLIATRTLSRFRGWGEFFHLIDGEAAHKAKCFTWNNDLREAGSEYLFHVEPYLVLIYMDFRPQGLFNAKQLASSSGLC